MHGNGRYGHFKDSKFEKCKHVVKRSDFGVQNGGKMALKTNQKTDAIFDSKNVGFGSQNCTKMKPKGVP